MTRLQLNEIESNRADAPPLPLTVAPYTSSDNYKSPYSSTRSLAKCHAHHFSIESRHFTGSAMKKESSPTGQRRIISLGTGRPTSDYYPWESLAFHGVSPVPVNYDFACTLERAVLKQGETYNLSIGLNYSHASGSAHLLRFITEHVELIHNPPYSNWATFLSSGSTAAMEAVFRVLCNRGDTILTEQYTYPGTLESATMKGIKVQGVEMDADGLLSDALDKVLSSWDTTQSSKPHVLYTVPTGQNPTGCIQPLDRRKAIYEVAEKHDLIIIEDDPYYFLQMPRYHHSNGNSGISGSNGQTTVDETSVEAFHSQCIPSFLSLDTSGRVVRLDSAAKVLAPGLRAGWVTASSQIIEKFLAYQERSTISVSGPSQLMLWHLLDESWGHSGFLSWLMYLSQEYQWRRDIVLDACNLYLPKEIAQWVAPASGMFLWIKLDWRHHPQLAHLNRSPDEIDARILEIELQIANKSLEKGVLVTRGSLFSSNNKLNGQLHFRLTFAAASREDLKEGVRLFAEALRECFEL